MDRAIPPHCYKNDDTKGEKRRIMALKIFVQSLENILIATDQKNRVVTKTSFYKTTDEGSANP